MKADLNNYSFLWNGSEAGWVLLSAPDLRGGFCIFNRKTSKLLHLDDEALNLELCQKLRERGAEILEDLPPLSEVQVKRQ